MSTLRSMSGVRSTPSEAIRLVSDRPRRHTDDPATMHDVTTALQLLLCHCSKLPDDEAREAQSPFAPHRTAPPPLAPCDLFWLNLLPPNRSFLLKTRFHRKCLDLYQVNTAGGVKRWLTRSVRLVWRPIATAGTGLS
jgi:hypothetical protein